MDHYKLGLRQPNVYNGYFYFCNNKDQLIVLTASILCNLCRPSWLVDSNRIATKIKSASSISQPERTKWNSNPTRACPNCQHVIDNSDVRFIVFAVSNSHEHIRIILSAMFYFLSFPQHGNSLVVETIYCIYNLLMSSETPFASFYLFASSSLHLSICLSSFASIYLFTSSPLHLSHI